jgi:septum formation protein
MSVPHSPRLVLASTSAYRRSLLERFGVPFQTSAPGVDETPTPGEEPMELAIRLARSKAEAVAQRSSDAVIIGSDQLAACGRQVLGKPGTEAKCREQLQLMNGQRVHFFTAVHVIDSRSQNREAHLEVTTVHFRKLTSEEIHRYVARERPLDCAGSFRMEALGITLFDRIDSQDPTALMGLPLIWVAGALRRAGFQVP